MRMTSNIGSATALIALLALTTAMPAAASNLGFLKQAPIANFTERDLDLANGALGRALRSPEPGSAFDWTNPDTKAGGKVTFVRAFERDGRTCREVEIVNRAQGRTGKGNYSLCQVGGVWKLAR